VFYDDSGDLISVPIAWTDLAEETDPFVALSGGRAYLHPADLLALADLVEGARA
jgi:hypothetical protein